MTDTTLRVAVFKGDGIGQDVTDAALAVIEASRKRTGMFTLHYEFLDAGAGYFELV